MAGVDFRGIRRRRGTCRVERHARGMRADEIVEVVKRVGEAPVNDDAGTRQTLVDLVRVRGVDDFLCWRQTFNDFKTMSRHRFSLNAFNQICCIKHAFLVS